MQSSREFNELDQYLLGSIQLGMYGVSNAVGGIDRYFAGLLYGFETLGARYTAGAFCQASGSERIHSLGSSKAMLPFRWWRIGRYLSKLAPSRRLRNTVIATHFALYGLPALRFARDYPLVVHFQGPWALESGREGESRLAVWAKRWIERRVYRAAFRCIAMSEAFARLLIENYGVDRARVRVVPGGIDVEKFRPRGGKLDARRRLGWEPSGPVVVCVRRLARRMGIEVLLEAWVEVIRRVPNARLVIGGGGPLATELNQRINELGLHGSARLIGFVPEDQLALVYEAADISIVPSQDLEGFGLVILESLACGTPVLVSPVGGMPEVVRDLDTTLILRGKTAAAIMDGTIHALQDPRSLPSLSACRHYVESSFTWPIIARRVLAVYEEALTEFRRSTRAGLN